MLCLAAGILFGCRKSSDLAPTDPKQAASQLQQAFEGTAQEVRQTVNAASDAMRQGNYEAAVVSLQTIKSREGVTLEQGLAIHHSTVTMEAQLIRAIESGDEQAKRAYQLLKALKRD